MKSIDLIDELRKMQKVVFSVNDIAKIINKPKKYASLFMHRLKNRGKILEIERNKYVLEGSNPYAIFSNLCYPSYISLLASFSFYWLTTQISRNIQIMTLKPKKKIKFEDYEVDFVKLPQKRFFGYSRERTFNGFIFIADIEKAIIDSLYFQKCVALDEVQNALRESIKKIDQKKMIKYAFKMDNSVLLKRLGYILETLGIDIYKQVKKKINKKYDYLMFIGKKGIKNRKWRIIINKDYKQNAE